jgi:hypothetical protein
MKYFRAQGIKDFWEVKRKHKQSLESFIDETYRDYRTLMERCSEKPLPKGKWLLEYTELSNECLKNV